VSVLRVHRHKRDFTITANVTPKNQAMSLRARGLLWFLLAQPDGFPVNATELACEMAEARHENAPLVKEGREAVETAIRELVFYGHLGRRREQNSLGQWITYTDVFEVPELALEAEGDGTTDNGSPVLGPNSADDGSPVVGGNRRSEPKTAGRPDNGSADAGSPVAKDQGLTDKDKSQGQKQPEAAPPGDAEAIVFQIKPRSCRSKPRVEEHPEARALCDLLADLIAARVGERPDYNGKWLDAARLLLTRDNNGQGYTVDQVKYLIEWSQEHEFWQGNILSMPKLRAQRLTLIAQIRRDRGATRREMPHERARRESMEELDRLAAQEEAEPRAAGGMS
jgi:hypothetical protein